MSRTSLHRPRRTRTVWDRPAHRHAPPHLPLSTQRPPTPPPLQALPQGPSPPPLSTAPLGTSGLSPRVWAPRVGRPHPSPHPRKGSAY